MPIYQFQCEQCGERLERIMPVQRFKFHPRCPQCGQKMFRDVIGEQRGVASLPGTWPMYSDAAGVAPKQVQEARAHSVRIGIPTDFTSDGRAVFTSRLHRKRYCEAVGLYDRNAGFSDPKRMRRKEPC